MNNKPQAQGRGITPLQQLKIYAGKIEDSEELGDPGDVINRLLTLISQVKENPLPSSIPTEAQKEFQFGVGDWMHRCFGDDIASDVTERNHRFIEEALELVQSTGATKSECYQLVDYVFRRDVGEINQEVGGVMVTLAALCNAIGLNMNKAGDTELTRVWANIKNIRAKQAAKPKHSPLPTSSAPPISHKEDEKVSIVETFRQLRELGVGKYWDSVACVCEELGRGKCECNCQSHSENKQSKANNI